MTSSKASSVKLGSFHPAHYARVIHKDVNPMFLGYGRDEVRYVLLPIAEVCNDHGAFTAFRLNSNLLWLIDRRVRRYGLSLYAVRGVIVVTKRRVCINESDLPEPAQHQLPAQRERLPWL